jgi:iron complex outermembrane receptor protein
MRLSYYNINYRDRIGTIPNIAAALTDPANSVFVLRNPSAALQAELLATAPPLDNETGMPYDPANIAALVDGRAVNVSDQRVQGADALLTLSLRTGASTIDASLAGAYMDLIQRYTATSAEISFTGTAFNPPRWRSRAMLTWSISGWSLTGSTNFLGQEVNNEVAGNPEVASWTTFDARLAYLSKAEGVFKNTGLSVSVTNIFDTDPPYLQFDVFRRGFNYDSPNVSPRGRFVTVQLSKGW